MQKKRKTTAKTQDDGAQGDDVEEKTEETNAEKATSANATKKVRFHAVLTSTWFHMVLQYSKCKYPSVIK